MKKLMKKFLLIAAAAAMTLSMGAVHASKIKDVDAICSVQLDQLSDGTRTVTTQDNFRVQTLGQEIFINGIKSLGSKKNANIIVSEGSASFRIRQVTTDRTTTYDFYLDRKTGRVSAKAKIKINGDDGLVVYDTTLTGTCKNASSWWPFASL